MTSTTKTRGSGLSDMLLELASPDLYRANPFRVLGLPVDASVRDVKRREQELAIERKTGARGEARSCVLPLVPPPDYHAIRDAVHSLMDPEERLLHEIFWFWPCRRGEAAEEDEGIGALLRGDYQGAISHWERLAAGNQDGAVSAHNLALLSHLLALDFEHSAARRTLTEKEQGRKDSYWRVAYWHWGACLSHKDFWQRLSRRAEELDDPRLSSRMVDALREALAVAVLLTNARQAVVEAEKGNAPQAVRHVEFIRQAKLPADAKDRALCRAAAQVRDRIRQASSAAEGEANVTPDQGYEIAMRLMQQMQRPLSVLDTLFPENHTLRQAAHDEVATAVLRMQIGYGKATDDMNRSAELLEKALLMVEGVAARQRLTENLEIVKGNLVYGICWFCGRHPKDEGAKVAVAMHGNVTVENDWANLRRVRRWNSIKIEVPRCKGCRTAHVLGSLFVVAGAVVGGLLGALGDVLGFLIGAGAGLGLGYGAYRAAFSGTKRGSAKNQFQAVKEKLEAGWHFGEKPPS